ncbi:MAG: TraB/GumN family protein, partial [Caulobacteraceae bacterium]|nr:TraB/GumN family protein [Caulobacter sp.]
RGAGELWILPAPPALPRDLRWSRRRLEGVLSGARTLVTPSAYRLERVGRSPRAPALPLSARLPPSVRDRFEAAAAVLGEGPAAFDRLAPLDAAYRLRDDAWRAAGLDADQPDATIRDLARRAGAAVRPAADYRVRLDAAAPALSDRGAAACVDAAVDEADWARAHAADAARAWALGDARAWLAQARPAGVARCLDAAPAFAALRARNLSDVAAAAQAALAGGGRSVLLTSPDLLLREGGLLERLRAAGDSVDPPVTDR